MSTAVNQEVTPAADSAERRTFFRITDAVALHVEPLDEAGEQQFRMTLEQRRESGQDVDHSAHAHVIWRNLEDNYPEVAAYLSRLEQRIDALQRQIGDLSGQAPLQTPTHSVNISGSGLHFESEVAYFIGQSVRVTMRLFPSGLTIDALARVVREHKRATPASQGKFSCALQFSDILPGEREALLQHIHVLQMDALRARTLDED